MKNKMLKKLSEDDLQKLLSLTSTRLSSLENWTAENIQAALNDLLAETDKKPGELFSLIRLAISFAPFSPSLDLTLEVLGKERTLARLNLAARSIN